MNLFRSIALLALLLAACMVPSADAIRADDTAIVALPKITPPAIPNGKLEIPLPETVDQIDVGGGGRYIALHFKALSKIGIFDCNELKIIGYVSAVASDTQFGAGANKLVVVSGKEGVISRWDLANQQRELTQTIDLGGPAAQALLGSASSGPAIVSSTGSRYDGNALSVDMQSLRATPFEGTNARRGFGGGAQVRISADGNVISSWAIGVSPSGLQSFVKTNNQWIGRYEHDSVGYIIPSPDGRLLYTAHGIFTNQLRHIVKKTSAGYSIPALHGPYYVTISSPNARGSINRGGETKEQVFLKLEGDDRPLVAIENLEPTFQDGDQWSRQMLTLEKRLLLIPDANLVLQLASSGQKLFAVEFDIDKALQEAEVDFLIVTSRPPLAVKSGEKISYQLKTKSRAGGVSYSLDSAPEGMTISPTGLLSWTTTSKSPATSDIIVSVTDKSSQQLFHTFKLKVEGGDTNPSSVASTVASGEIPDPLPVTPSTASGEPREVTLPGTLHDVTLGGAGRFLVMHMPELRKVAVFDVSQAKIVGYLPASDDNTIVTAGATRAVIFNLNQGVITRYRLDNLKRDLTVTIPFPESIQFADMGSGSEGPILLRTSAGTSALDQSGFHFLDINTMRPLEVEWPNGRQPHSVYRDRNTIRASTDGTVFVVNGVGVIRLNGKSVNMISHHSSRNGLGVPSADGKYFYSNGGVLSSSLQPLDDQSAGQTMLIPSVTGNYYLSMSNPMRFSRPGENFAGTKLYLIGNERPLVTLPEFSLGRLEPGRSQYAPLSVDRRVMFIPKAEVMIMIPWTNDRLELRPFNLDEALNDSGVDYLIVSSTAPPHAIAGEQYTYSIQVKSKRGDVKYTLDAGPEGMKISADGKLTWNVPEETKEIEQKVIVSIGDASGQSIFHTFAIDLPGVQEQQLAVEKQREEERRAAMRNAQREVEQKRLAEIRRQTAERLARETAAAEQRAAEQKAIEAARAKAMAANAAAANAVRTWTDTSGGHKVEARFVEIVDKKTVVLKLTTGQQISVPLTKLSAEDIYEAVRLDLKRQGMQPAVEKISPFKPR